MDMNFLRSIKRKTRGKKNKSKIQAMDMKFLRSITGKTRKAELEIKYLEEEVGIENLLIELEEKRLPWFGHIKRTDTENGVRIII
jgi:hypothetical protein